jgi:hypothetical protein
MTRGLALLGLLLVTTLTAAAQSTTPELSKTQRETLRQIVAAVDAASGEPETANVTWQTHVLRASDGSHYVAFSAQPPGRIQTTAGPLILYVRLATTTLSGQGVERSAVADWLAGRSSDPLLRPRTGIAIGEMPNFGAAGLIDPNRPGRPVAVPSGSNDLRLLQLERERAREEKEERDKKRRAELEGAAKAKRDLLPFEDFDLAASASTVNGAIQRALTAGPGDYELYVAWVDSSAKPSAPIQVLKRTLHLPPANASELSISSVIVADDVTTRTVPYPPPQQAAHPYSIGLTEITPARDTIFSRDDRLNVAFQVINARPSEIGKPDIGIAFRIVRVNGDREQPVASLTPQEYTADTLPGDFDLRLGHPIFAAMSVPLATLTRGEYRLKIAVNDRVSGRGMTGDTNFTVVGTPASLLAEAPSVGAPFRREMALEPAVIEEVANRLRPNAPSSALTRAIDMLRQRRFVELMREEQFGTRELGYRAALTGVALYALGDSSSTVQFQRSIQLDVPPGPALFFIGAARALEGRDLDAATAWQGAVDGGMPPAIVTPLLVNAHLRRGDLARANSLMDPGSTAGWNREQVALHIASGREREAIPLLERRLAAEPADADAEWLLLHALYASVVRGQTGPMDRASADKFARAAQAYVAKEGVNRSLVTEWLKVVAP